MAARRTQKEGAADLFCAGALWSSVCLCGSAAEPQRGGGRDAVSGTEVSALLRDGCWSSRATGEGAVLREIILPRRSEARARAVRVAYCWPPSGAPGGGGRGGGWRQLPIEEGAGRHLRRSPGRLGPIAGDDVNPRWTSSTQASRPREPSAPGERPYHLRKNGKRAIRGAPSSDSGPHGGPASPARQHSVGDTSALGWERRRPDMGLHVKK